ncbi:hypothetical protein BpHYR1_042816 [Brachionus plicatilis]|uniref:Uncharacterized protein n=1 Tax=Brachionus plicatilis TaxID=10195 RepID=A0A3M7Q3V0_BRAPC|nr:hypothetical protein BpHYR1_042816 [Brachionus plicatilis]
MCIYRMFPEFLKKIMDDIESDNFSPIPKSRVKTRVESIFESQSQPDFVEEHTYFNKKKINNIQSEIAKRSKISIDILFEDENSQLKSKKAVPIFKEKIQLHSDDDISIEESDEIFKKGYVKEKNSKYNIDDILTEENPPEINARPNFEKLSSEKSSENEYKKFNNNIENLDELIGDSSPLNKKKIVTTASSKYVDDIQDDYLDSYKLKPYKAKCKKLADIDDILKNDQEFHLPINEKKQVDYLFVSNNFLRLEEMEAHSSNRASITDPNLSSQEKYSEHLFDIGDDINFNSQVRQNKQIDKKANWMQEINLKLNETSVLISGNESNILANASEYLKKYLFQYLIKLNKDRFINHLFISLIL